MNKQTYVSLAAALPIILSANTLHAQAFSWEAEIEIGIEETVDSDDPTAEIRDIFTNIEATGELSFANSVTIFSTLAIESLTDPVADREFDDVGLFVKELGFSFDVGPATVALGKLTPTFGVTWDDSVGYFGASLAEDYELTEVIGTTIDVPVGQTGGVFSIGLYYLDDTSLSRSIGFDRGRNSTAAGGAGNTGRLDNVTLAWTQEMGDTKFQVGARHLSAGTGDVDDETGFVASVSHPFENGLFLFAEVASFDNFGGTADDATYATLNAAYGFGNWTASATLAHRDLDSSGETDLFSIALERELENGIVLGGGIAWVDEVGVDNTVIGLNAVIPLGT